MDTHTIIDRRTFNELKETMGAGFVSEIIDTFNLETGRLIEQLRQALAEDDAVSFARLAHAIKSSSASLGALVFSQQARELEMLGKANDLTGASPKLEKFAADFARVTRCLEEMSDEP